MASATDIRSALNLPEAGPSQPKKLVSAPKRPEGITRELYSLIGPSQPYLATQPAKPRLKQKPKFGTAGSNVTKWCVVQICPCDITDTCHRELRSFKNPARKDGLELKHWVKASEDPNAGKWRMYSICGLLLIEYCPRVSLCKVQHSKPRLHILPGRVLAIPRYIRSRCHPQRRQE